MYRSLFTTALFLALFSPTQGAQTVALHANFNADTVKAEPANNPAGDPDGDFLLIWHQGGNVLVQASYGAMTDQPLLFDRTTVPATFGMEARLDTDLRTCDSYVVRWTSMVAQTVGFWPVSLRGPNGALMGGLEYRGANALTFNSTALSVGYTPGVPQDFEITVDLVGATLSLSIDGTPVPEVQDWPTTSPELWSVNFSPGLTDLNQYILDDLEVIASGCSVTTASRSWSAVKVRY